MTTEYTHTPVMCEKTVEMLKLRPGSVVVDATLGRAGHGRILARTAMTDGGTYIGIDLDNQALIAARPIMAQLQEELAEGEYLLVQGSFGDLDQLLSQTGIAYVDTFLFDVGVSSPQIDDLGRGFSFKNEAPLDMRMNQDADVATAADLIAELDKTQLTRIFRDYGEEKWASRIADFIVGRRDSAPIETSSQLVDIIKAAIPTSARRAGGHPAKRTFQALRIAVNDELGALERGLESAIRWLRPGGRLGVLTFHSLEDRIVKQAFQAGQLSCECLPNMPVCMCEQQAVLKVLTKRPLQPTEEEIEENPRARSTKLRVAEKL